MIWGDNMSSRMDKYSNENETTSKSRISKNQKIYNELYTNSSFTEFADIDSNVIELSKNLNLSNKREDYQKAKNFSNVFEKGSTKKNIHENNSHNFIEPSLKNYDINSVLEEAKKNRNDNDELEKKRKLKTIEEYDILSNLTQDKIDSYKEKKREVISEEEEEQLQDLIDAVTANFPTVTADEADLFEDLMPTNLDETIVSNDLSEELNGIANLEVTFEHTFLVNKEKENQNEQEEKTDVVDTTKYDYDTVTTSTDLELDDSFYSKSMDFTDSDLMDTEENEIVSSNKHKKKKNSKILIILLILILFAIFGVIIYSLINGII